MIIDHIKTGDRVEITYPSPGEEDNAILLSKVEAVIDESSIMIHAPISRGSVIKLPREPKYSMLFLTEDGMYRFTTEVINYLKIDGFYITTVKLVSSGEKVQRRNFFRLNCDIPVSFVDINDKGEQICEKMQDGIILDISGGGMRFSTGYNMEEKSLIRSMVMLGDEYVMLFAQVLKKQRLPQAVPPYQYAVKFAAISNAEQERIIQYIYNEQRKSLLRS